MRLLSWLFGEHKNIQPEQNEDLEEAERLKAWHEIFGGIRNNKELIAMIEHELCDIDSLEYPNLLSIKNTAITKLMASEQLFPVDFDFRPSFLKIPVSLQSTPEETKLSTIILLLNNINKSSMEHIVESVVNPA